MAAYRWRVGKTNRDLAGASYQTGLLNGRPSCSGLSNFDRYLTAPGGQISATLPERLIARPISIPAVTHEGGGVS